MVLIAIVLVASATAPIVGHAIVVDEATPSPGAGVPHLALGIDAPEGSPNQPGTPEAAASDLDNHLWVRTLVRLRRQRFSMPQADLNSRKRADGLEKDEQPVQDRNHGKHPLGGVQGEPLPNKGAEPPAP